MTRFQSPRASLWLTLAALVALCSVAIAPLLTGVMPETADGGIHLYRLPVLQHAFQDGSLYPRYPVATAYGYGSPVFNFYSPFSLYPMHALRLVGLSYTHAWLAGMALYVLVAAGGAYLLGRTWGGGAVGVVTAAAYVYAPYFIYDYLWRGTTSETAALAILPYVLWAIKTQADHPSRRTFLAVIISLAAFVPMHNVTTINGGALIGLYAIFVVVTARDRLRAAMRVFGALALGALLATFYWFPAVRETANIKIDAITDALPEIDVTRNLVSAWTAFQLPYPADPSLQQPPFAVAFGWPQLVCGALGLLTLFAHPRRIRALLILAAVGIAFLVFMLTPASAPIWRVLPFIGYSQYPTRLLGPASLLLAVLSGYGVGFLVRRALRLNGKMVRIGVPVVVMILFTLPLGVRTPIPEYNPQSVVDSIDFEVENNFVASSSFGEYLPVWVETMPDAAALRDLYAEQTFIPRLRPPEGVTLADEIWRHTSGAFTVTAAERTALTLDWLYMPYFQSTLDGEPLEVTPSAVEGRVQIAVPEGTHRVEIWLARSRTQAISTVVSGMALLATIGILILWPLLRGKPAVAYLERFETSRETRRALIAAVIVGLLALGVKAAFDLVPNPLRQERFSSGYEAGVQHVTDANFNREITLIGYDAPTEAVPAGTVTSFALYWTPRVKLTKDYIAVFTLRDADGVEIAQTTYHRPGGLETHHWRPGQYLTQRAGVLVPAATPPGTYSVFVSLYDRERGASLDVIGAADDPIGVAVSLGTVEVTRGETLQHEGMADTNTPTVGTGTFIHDYDGVRALEFTGIPRSVTAGQIITVYGLWGLKGPAPTRTFSIEWQTPSNTVIASSPLDLNSPYPMALWQVNDVWRIPHRVIVPPDAVGETVLYLKTEGSILYIGSTIVVAPQRIFTLPDGVTLTNVGWNNGIALAGYQVNDASVTLYWTVDTPLILDLRRFVHLLTADGGIAQVVDGIPADWTRPVTGWLPGEYVADTVPIAALVGQTLRLGFADARTGLRVPVAGSDVFDLVLP